MFLPSLYKLKYHERLVNKLSDSKTTFKTYKTILETFISVHLLDNAAKKKVFR